MQPDGSAGAHVLSGESEASRDETNAQLDLAQYAFPCPVAVAAGAAVARRNELPPMTAPPVADALGDERLEVLARHEALRADGGSARSPLNYQPPRTLR